MSRSTKTDKTIRELSVRFLDQMSEPNDTLQNTKRLYFDSFNQGANSSPLNLLPLPLIHSSLESILDIPKESNSNQSPNAMELATKGSPLTELQHKPKMRLSGHLFAEFDFLTISPLSFFVEKNRLSNRRNHERDNPHAKAKVGNVSH